MSREKNGIEGKIWLQVQDRWAGAGRDGGPGQDGGPGRDGGPGWGPGPGWGVGDVRVPT